MRSHPRAAPAEQVLICDGWRFVTWDCIIGIKETLSQKGIEEIRDPVMALQFLSGHQDTVLLCHNLHRFLDNPGLIQAIQNGIPIWKSKGCSLVMISPVIHMRTEVEKYFHVIDHVLSFKFRVTVWKVLKNVPYMKNKVSSLKHHCAYMQYF